MTTKKKVPFGSSSVRTAPMTKTHEDLFPGPAHYTNTDKKTKQDAQPSSTFASLTDRLHSPPPIVKVKFLNPVHTSSVELPFLPKFIRSDHCDLKAIWSYIQPWLKRKILGIWGKVSLFIIIFQNNPPPGSYDVRKSYDKTQGMLILQEQFFTVHDLTMTIWQL